MNELCDTLRDTPHPVAKAKIMGSITTGSSRKAVVTAADEPESQSPEAQEQGLPLKGSQQPLNLSTALAALPACPLLLFIYPTWGPRHSL